MNDQGSKPPASDNPPGKGDGLLDLDAGLADALNPPPADTEGATLFSIAAAPTGNDAALNTLLAIGPSGPQGDLPPATVQPAQQRYEIMREHARGGMGRVLLARDVAVGREVALKELLPGRQGSSGVTRKTGTLAQAERFLREARVTGQLEHPGIVPVYEIGQRPDGSPFYTMKFVRGRTLADRVRETRDSQATGPEKLARRLKLLDAFTTVCEAVAFAHSRGVIHRDLKPQNLMLGDFGETLVLDWGLARVKNANESTSNLPPLPRIEPASSGSGVIKASSVISSSSVPPPVTGTAGVTNASAATMDGAVIGTPAYMSPEQAAGNISEVDEQSDLYSLGAILYEIVTGVPPYEGSTPESVVKKVLHGPPQHVLKRQPDAPPELAALIDRAMHRERAGRLRMVNELVEQVRAFREGRTLSVYQYSTMELARRFVARHRAATLITLLAVAALLGSGVWYFLQITEQKQQAEDARAVAELQRTEAESQRAEAMSQRERALALTDSEKRARQETERQARETDRQRQGAVSQRQQADRQRALAVEALEVAEARLADAYAMRARIALDEGRYNEALSFAAESLQHGEQAEARGILIATPSSHPLLQRMVPRFTQQSRFEEIYGVAVSPDGRYVATGISEGTVWIWDTITGKEVATLPSVTGSAMCVAFHPDGESLSVGYADGTIRIWSMATFTVMAQVLAHEPAATLGPRRVLSLEYSPDGSMLASGATFGQVRVSHARSLAPIHQWLVDPAAWMQVVSWSRDQRRISAASSDNLIRVVDTSTGEVVQRLSAHEGIAYSCHYSPDGRYLASGSWDTTVRLWDSKGELVDTLRGHSSIVLSVQFSPDGKTLASGSADGTVALWNVESRKRVNVIPGQGAWVHSVAFTPDGSALAVRTVEGTVTLWWLGHSNARQLVGHTKELFDVRFSPDGSRLLTCSWDGSAILWDSATLAPLQTFRGHMGWIMSCTFSPDGTEVATSGFDGTVRIWDKSNGKEVRTLVGVVGTPMVHVCYSPDGKLLAGSSVDNTVRLWDRQSGRNHAILRGHDNPIAELSFSPDGKLLASVSADKTCRIWDVAKLVEVRVLRGHTDALPSCDFSPDGKLLATGSVDRTIRIWDTASWECLKIMHGHTEGVHNVRFTRDAKRLYTGSGDKTVRLWDIAAGRQLLVLPGHEKAISRIAISPDETMVASASLDATARIWPVNVLTLPPAKIRNSLLLMTGLTIEGFGSFAAQQWPPADHDAAELARIRAPYAENSARFLAKRRADLEPWRCGEAPGADGRMRRRYHEPRKLDAQGNYIGRPLGVVDFRGFFEQSRIPQLDVLPIVEVIKDGTGEKLGLKVGDLLWAIDGRHITSREELRAAMEAAQPMKWTIRRLARDDAGNPRKAQDAAGIILDDTGRPLWEYTEFEVEIPAGRIGLRIDEARIAQRPAR